MQYINLVKLNKHTTKTQISLPIYTINVIAQHHACTDPEGGGGRGPGPLSEKSQKYRFLAIMVLIPEKNHKAAMSAFNVGPSSAR